MILKFNGLSGSILCNQTLGSQTGKVEVPQWATAVRKAFLVQLATRLTTSGFYVDAVQMLDPAILREQRSTYLQAALRVFEHWRLPLQRLGVTYPGLLHELDGVAGTVDPMAERPWTTVIVQRGLFPNAHVLYRRLTALSPSDADVERLFSRLANILTAQRRCMGEKMPEKFLHLSVNAPSWEAYDFVPAVTKYEQAGSRRTHLRVRRKDALHQHAKRPKVNAPQPARAAVHDSSSDLTDSTLSTSASSDSEC